jgi:DNA-binding GntR family transcriptional regulator
MVPTASPAPVSPFRALPRQSLADGVAEQIRRAIINAGLAEGSAIAEAQLAARLGVSRGPVREALFQLEREGLVVFDDRGRSRVRVLSDGDFRELSTLRLSLESMSVGLAAERLTPADRAKLEDNLRRCEEASTLDEMSRLDIEFHDFVMQAARHERLLICWRTIVHQVEWWLARNYRRHAAKAGSTRPLVMKGQRDLYKAIRSGDPRKAVAQLQAHIGAWRKLAP